MTAAVMGLVGSTLHLHESRWDGRKRKEFAEIRLPLLMSLTAIRHNPSTTSTRCAGVAGVSIILRITRVKQELLHTTSQQSWRPAPTKEITQMYAKPVNDLYHRAQQRAFFTTLRTRPEGGGGRHRHLQSSTAHLVYGAARRGALKHAESSASFLDKSH